MLAASVSITDSSNYTSTSNRVNLEEWDGVPAQSKMEVVLRYVYAMMRRKITSSPKDQIGVYMYHTVGLLSLTSYHSMNSSEV